MSRQESTAQKGTCRTCRCSIINHGTGWYHTSERPTAPFPGHFAEPVTA